MIAFLASPDDPATITTTADPASITPAPANTIPDTVTMGAHELCLNLVWRF